MTLRGKTSKAKAHRDDDWDDVPLSGDPAGDLAVMRTGDGHVALVPVAIQRLRGEPLEAYAQLQDRARALSDHRDDLATSVHECRSLGVSWNSIAFALGVTGQAARQRWGLAAVLDDRGQVSALGGHKPRNR